MILIKGLHPGLTSWWRGLGSVILGKKRSKRIFHTFILDPKFNRCMK